MHLVMDVFNKIFSVIMTLSIRDWALLLISAIAIASGSTILGLILLNYIVLRILQERNYLEKWNATKVVAVILMLRTNKGQKFLEMVSRPRKFWRIFGEISIWIAMITLFFTTLLVISLFTQLFSSSRESISFAASEVLIIPGYTTGIPFFWPLIALIVALVVHEYGHGILMRAHGMRVKSFGLLIFSLIPIGAFAEPEYRELIKAPKRERMRIYAAGPAVNLVFATFLVIILAVGMSGVNSTIEGAYSPAIVKDGPADESGLEPYDIVIAGNNQSISSSEDLRNMLNSSKAGDILVLTILKYNGTNGIEWEEEEIIQVTLGDYFEYLRSQNISAEELERNGIFSGDAFLGVSSDSFGPAIRNTDYGKNNLMGPFYPGLTTEQRIISALIYPLDLVAKPFEKGGMMDQGEANMLDFGMLEFFLIEGIFWFLWINFALGFANLIPVIPFDGGHIMRDTINSTINWITEKTRLLHPQKAEILATKISNIFSLFFFLAFLIPIVFGLLN